MVSREEPTRGPVRSYQDLDVWQLGMDLTEKCYRLTRSFPREELFGLTSQIRRAASSIPFNIAEGWGRESTGAYVNSLRIAQGSLKELETQIILARRLELVDENSAADILQMTESEGRMIRALIRALGTP